MMKPDLQHIKLPSFLLQVQVPRRASARDITALETVMQGLTLDERHPIALELAATSTSRLFLLRASTPAALNHLAAQVSARYPQAEMVPPDEDPLYVQQGESVHAVELLPGAASYLPLRSWRERELLKEGSDPLLGLLAAFSDLPPYVRVVAQLALLPASPTWSQGERRRTVEHPLEAEHLRQRQALSRSASSAPGTVQLVGLGLLVALLLLWMRFSKRIAPLLPTWLLHAGVQLLHGRLPVLTSSQETLVVLVGSALLFLFLSTLFLFSRVASRRSQDAIYDMRLVNEKTARMAYRARLRLFVIASNTGQSAGMPPLVPAQSMLATAFRSMPYPFSSLFPLPFFQWSAWWSSFLDVYRQRRQEWSRRTEQRQMLQNVLSGLVAAYRQYHTAAGGYFVPRSLSHAKARRLLLPSTEKRPGWERNVRRSRHLLSVADVAALWHLPQEQDLADLPFVIRGRARTYLVPAELAHGNGWHIGESSHAGQHVPVYLPQECLRHNLLSIASTGKGKSTLFQHLAQAALNAAGNGQTTDGLVVIEPHGDLVETLTGLIPPTRRDDVVVIDLADGEYPVGINPLDVTLGRNRDKAVDNLITIFARLCTFPFGKE